MRKKDAPEIVKALTKLSPSLKSKRCTFIQKTCIMLIHDGHCQEISKVCSRHPGWPLVTQATHLLSIKPWPLCDDAPSCREFGLLCLGVVTQVDGLGLSNLEGKRREVSDS